MLKERAMQVLKLDAKAFERLCQDKSIPIKSSYTDKEFCLLKGGFSTDGRRTRTDENPQVHTGQGLEDGRATNGQNFPEEALTLSPSEQQLYSQALGEIVALHKDAVDRAWRDMETHSPEILRHFAAQKLAGFLSHKCPSRALQDGQTTDMTLQSTLAQFGIVPQMQLKSASPEAQEMIV